MREGTRELERAVALRPDWTTARRRWPPPSCGAAGSSSRSPSTRRWSARSIVRGLAAGDARSRRPRRAGRRGGRARRRRGALSARAGCARRTACTDAPRTCGDRRRGSPRGPTILLAEMLDRGPVPWGDPGAERAKALALDPGVAGSDLLPPFPDPRVVPELQPYTWPVATAERDSLAPVPDVLPVLAEWPTPETRAVSEFQGTVTVEALVARDGRVSEAGRHRARRRLPGAQGRGRRGGELGPLRPGHGRRGRGGGVDHGRGPFRGRFRPARARHPPQP